MCKNYDTVTPICESTIHAKADDPGGTGFSEFVHSNARWLRSYPHVSHCITNSHDPDPCRRERAEGNVDADIADVAEAVGVTQQTEAIEGKSRLNASRADPGSQQQDG
jgi:hypothetical protein